MNCLKSLFISAYLTLITLGSARAIWMSISEPGWSWVVLALLPAVLFFVWVFLGNVARTGKKSAVMWIAPVISMVAMAGGVGMERTADIEQWFWAVCVGLGGGLTYILWYSRFAERKVSHLEVGATLPVLEFEAADGSSVSTADLSGPLLLMFYRGNWCPLCMAQIKEIAASYQTLAEKGVQLMMISPQSHKNTAALAKRFDVPMHFLIDNNLRVAKQLNIEALSGLPAGLEWLGYDSDTVMPTVIITDANRKILYADQTANYRIRPEPDDFLKVLAGAR